MKKIGVLTLPLANHNYGGLLQAAALCGFLQEKGYDAVLIDKIRDKALWRRAFAFVMGRIPGQNVKNHRYRHLKTRLNAAFLAQHLRRRTEPLATHADLRRMAERERFDAVIVGSDQVWRWTYISEDPYYRSYFLDFVDGNVSRKIAYAASFGHDDWQRPDKVPEVTPLLRTFHAVSVRESSGLAVCRGWGRGDCEQALDPTLLVEAHFYDRFPSAAQTPGKKPLLLSYLIDASEGRANLLDQLRQAHAHSHDAQDIVLKSDLSIPDWVDAFRQADKVITDSFHGMVFAILFNKPFVVIGNVKRGLSRFQSLLEQLELPERLVQDGSGPEQALALLNEPIAYEQVNQRLAALRQHSARFLLSAIHGGDLA